ncbi:MAG TPA: hypothetical protein V6D15_25725 [Oculatellaceae cyanobacterium]|jgi:hypothetical protein
MVNLRQKILNELGQVATWIVCIFAADLALLPITLPIGFLLGCPEVILWNIAVTGALWITLFFVCVCLWD